MEQTFGEYIREIRKSKKIKLKVFAEQCGVSAVYASYIETGRRPAPSKKVLADIERILELNKDESAAMYMLATLSRSKPAVPDDIARYIIERPYVREALKLAKEKDAGEEEWLKFQNEIL